jgi:hypothetical protein|tara:strand:- start:1372 stop:1569 length:198 start_codon:yes stop_codon:yes gene_type:complete
MATVDFTQYNLTFRAPSLPSPPKEYNQASFDQFNNVLRIYFNQLDSALRSSVLSDKSDAASWFLS